MNTAKQDESYLIRYRTNIMSRLKSIDLFLKTKSSPYCKKDVAELLGITYEELDKITDELIDVIKSQDKIVKYIEMLR